MTISVSSDDVGVSGWAAPFPPEWGQMLRKNLPLYGRLDEADRRELHGHIHVFLAEKHFEGCGGLTLTDEIKVTIAARRACCCSTGNRLLPPPGHRPRLPERLTAKGVEPLGGGFVLEGEEARLGEAWTGGVVVLSWDDVRAGAADIHDGHNVVLHEFAHQLDQEDGSADGAPILDRRSRYVAWARVLGAEYERLRRASRAAKVSVLDEYGATNPAEFFAVATECFFEKPAEMRRKHPELYEELKEYYRQDPERAVTGGGGASSAGAV